MKKVLLLVFICLSAVGFGQITIDESYTTQELVEDILIGNPNFPSSDYAMNSGLDYGQLQSVAAFNKNETTFPFSGIVLVSGYVQNVPGPNTELLGNGGSEWPGDADLEAVTDVTNTNNASSLQFNFIPAVSAISLEFLMGSEEYNQNFECSFADTFAFILTNNTLGTSENLAVLPDSSTPITVVTVHPEIPGGCDAENEEYFDNYNFLPYQDENEALINFNGQTVSFMILGDVTIGDSYTLKIVVADAIDTVFDSALFVKGGSFGAFPIIEDDPIDLYVSDGEDDGTAIFDLTLNEEQMLGDIDTTIYSFLFSYHLSEEDAEEGVNSIANPEAYQNVENPQTIHVRMENAYTGAHVQTSFQIETNGSLGVNDLFGTKFSIAPNPADERLQLTVSQTFDRLAIAIYDIDGRLLFSEEKKNISEQMNMDISFLNSGMYFLEIRSKNLITSKKLLKR